MKITLDPEEIEDLRENYGVTFPIVPYLDPKGKGKIKYGPFPTVDYLLSLLPAHLPNKSASMFGITKYDDCYDAYYTNECEIDYSTEKFELIDTLVEMIKKLRRDGYELNNPED